jgi:iron complex outermembrane recepter protein
MGGVIKPTTKPLMIRASSFNRALRLTSAAIALGFAALAVPSPSYAQATVAAARKTFNVPADNAETSLKRFSEQSGQEVLFPTDVVRGVRTNAVRGELSPRDALEQMVADTGLTVVQDARTGAFTVRRGVTPATAQPARRSEDGAVEL